ncbi:hypothetical protein DLAC_11268 [Tieghemostelium lacteum]|uniref:BTB domain-containing protein n=1 Tax=Tieghemostelium lacteum TaxID=361077 RepID=A0A151Z415_TIELA|nr:hypothetical protein DLAC_11268 [Tieghemostelium lacteum]|eukprot:KYQ88544.1 hypothetical protein DLAC_11268 [Tieghemostelium lacteum]
MANVGNEHNEWVALNVGGTTFHTTLSTLTSIKNTVLYKMFSSESKFQISRKDANGSYLIDRDPIYFRVLLNYLRSPSNTELIIDGEVSLRGVLQEAHYFHIEPLIDLIEKLENNKADFTRKDILLHKSSIKLNKKKLIGLDLSNIEFIKENFNQSNLSYCNFENSKLSYSTLLTIKAKHCSFKLVTAENTILSNSNLKYTNFQQGQLTHASFNNCLLSHSTFNEANCYGSLFQRATILNGSFKNSNLEHAKFQKANLQQCDFTGASIQNCHFTSADLRNCIGFDWKNIPSNAIFKKAKVTQQQFDEIQLPNKQSIGFKILEIGDDLNYINNSNNKTNTNSNSSTNVTSNLGTSQHQLINNNNNIQSQSLDSSIKSSTDSTTSNNNNDSNNN